MGKKRKHVSVEESSDSEEERVLPSTRSSDEPTKKKTRWSNRERVLIFSSRGVSFRDRHLMKDFKNMLPHSKADTKYDRKDQLFVINEICEMKNCSKCIFFEAKKKQDLYMWLSNAPNGPSVKFLMQNVHTMLELKMTGNCLKGTRPLLSFDEQFDSQPHWKLMKELFIQTFGTPNFHPKSQPFFDHVFTFTIADNRIWFRNYQITNENAEMVEIGPRMVLNPIKIFQGSFVGATLYQNPEYISPNVVRKAAQEEKIGKHLRRIETKKGKALRVPQQSYSVDPTEEVFATQ
ncbi:hypothetical protein CAPTEDRAFT_210368 [Capitella teleta]|uniref:Ribosome biogenesis protein BRX1 homolog n=1 Tax=Capitella teleta TaxID=283909 RepID=N1PBB0_CAPTE|nr:hypothetical protein CAPTEDRAFT_210368 [Capitella teleta]|eukprot:ELU18890.1 hypothetical protein CAPTEDRAFT_210368 [Capitella teleta]